MKFVCNVCGEEGIHATGRCPRDVRAAAFEEAVEIVRAEVNSYIPMHPDRHPDGTPIHVCRSRLVEKIRARAKEARK